MKRLSLSIVLTALSLSLAFGQKSIQDEVNAHLQNLPFSSFSITVPTFKDKVYNIKDAGAVGDGVTKCTDAINSTIKKCSAEGGGTVLIPAGLWFTGPITMQSNVNLHLEGGALVTFSDDLADNPLTETGKGKYGSTSLINGRDLENIAITGNGVFNGNGDSWRPVKKEKLTEKAWKNLIKTGEVSEDGKMWFPRKGTLAAIKAKEGMNASNMTKEDYDKIRLTFRSYLLNVENVKNMLVEGITLQNSPHITNMLRSIDGLTMKNVSVVNNWWAQNSDGLDISACKNVLLYDCTVNTGDDGICMKSSGGEKGKFRLENIVIKNCKVFHAHGGFVIGSNTDGGMRNIYVNNCAFSWTETGLRFKSDAGRGGRVEKIFIDGISMKDIEKEAIIFDLTYEDKAAINVVGKEDETKIPDMDGISIKNVYCDGAKAACVIGGADNAKIKNVSFENMIITANEGFSAFGSENITLDNVTINSKIKPSFSLNKTNGVTFKNIKNVPEGPLAKVYDASSKKIVVENSSIKASQIEMLNGADAKELKIK